MTPLIDRIRYYENAQKLLPPELLLLAQKCTKSFVGWSFAPDTTGGAYSAPPDPLAGWFRVGSRGKGRREGRVERREGRGGEWSDIFKKTTRYNV